MNEKMHEISRLVIGMARVGLVASVLLAAVARPTPARAFDTWTVNSLADGVATPGNCPGAGCRLRDALAAAAASGDTIDFGVNGTITLTDGQLTVNKSLTITGPGAGLLTIDADGLSRVMQVNGAGATVVMSGMELTGGNEQASNAGGGMYVLGVNSLTLDNMAIRDNSAGSGGATYSWGAGIYVTNGTVTITNSEISGNTVPATTVTSGGGGIYLGAAALSLTNVTVSGNYVLGSSYGHGGGIMMGSGSTLNLTNVTMQGNSASLAGGGLYVHPSAIAANIKNSILANNAVGNLIHGPDCETSTLSINSQDYNLLEDTFVCTFAGATTHNVTGTDPMLGGLAFNGAQTQSHELLAGSPAIGAGNDATSPATDQRGVSRPQGLHTDIGAFEALDPPDCYVDANAGGSNTGATWGNAYEQLYSALGNGACLEIWVANGIYKPGAAEGDSFEVDPGVAVYGGFASGETNLWDRDWDANLAVLSGDLDGDDTATNGVVLDSGDIVDGASGNSDHVVVMDGSGLADVTATTVLDGFTITAGQADGIGDDDGGGMHCNGTGSGSVCSPTLAHLTFSGNMASDDGGAAMFDGHAGGVSSPSVTDATFSGNAALFGAAIYNYGSSGVSSPTFQQAVFVGNEAGDLGGALYNDGFNGGESNPQFTDAAFTSNSAPNGGGAIFNDGGTSGTSSASFTDSTFTNNVTGDSGGALYNWGSSGDSSPTFLRVTFTNNDATDYGGAMYNDGSNGGVSDPHLTDVTITQSDADFGGGMYNDRSSPTLLRVTLSQNNATGDGGAIYNDGFGGVSSPGLTNVTFHDNHADNAGGAMENAAGTGISNPVLKNVTMTGNDATYGGAMGSYASTGSSNPSLHNVILWGNTAVTAGNEVYNDGAGATGTISYSVVAGGCASITGASCGAGNKSTNPNLDTLDDNGGFTQTIGLLAGSSAINSGEDAVCNVAPVSSLDQRSTARPQGTHCDIGAFELDGPTISGNTVAGATLNYGDGTSPADSLGDYEFLVPDGWSGTVAPSLTGCTFTPANNTYLNVTVDMPGEDYAATCSTMLRAIGSQDGWILESSETSGKGGSLNSTATELYLGDDAADRQYRGILSFNTGPALPDNVVVTSAILSLKKTGTVGGSNPFTSLGDLLVDIKQGPFSGNAALQLTDFYAAGSKNYVGKYTGAATTWISASLSSTALQYVNKTAGTQLRLRFATDDNDNLLANYMRFASGNAITTSRPQLVITYQVP